MTRLIENDEHLSELSGDGRDTFITIGSWEDGSKNLLNLQYFVRDGVNFIPLFSDDQHFVEETKGSGFEHSGIVIDRGFLLSILTGEEVLILNPGSSAPLQLRKVDL